MIGGALQGKIIYLLVEVPRGDIFVWSLVEYFAWLGWSMGLATGISMSMTRHVLGRCLLAPLLGIILVATTVGAYSRGDPVNLLGSSLQGGQAGLAEKPEGWGLYLGAPTTFAMTVVCHLARRALARPWTILSIPVLGGLLSYRADALLWDALWPCLSSRVPCGNGLAFDRLLVGPHLYGTMALVGLVVTGAIFAETAASTRFRIESVSVRRMCAPLANALLILGLLWGAQTLPWADASAVSAIAFSSDEEFLVSAHEGGTLRLWKLRDTEVPSLEEVDRVRLHCGHLRSVKFAVSSEMVAAWSNDGRVALWQVAPFRHLLDLEVPISEGIEFAMSPDGRSLLMSVNGFTLCLWNLRYEPGGTLSAVKKSLQEGYFSPSDAFVQVSWAVPRFAANSEWIVRPLSGFIEYIDRPTGKPRQYLLLQESVPLPRFFTSRLAAFSPDGTSIVAHDHGDLLIVRLPSGKVERVSHDSHNPINALAISPDGTELTIADLYHVKQWDLASLRVRQDWRSAESSDRVHCLEYAPSGHLLALGLGNGRIELQPSDGSRRDTADNVGSGTR
jgi:hypothetical protein